VEDGLTDSDPVRLGVGKELMDKLLVSDPVRLCVTDRVEEGLAEKLLVSVKVWEEVLEGLELGVGLVDPLTDPVRVCVGLGL